MKTVLRTYFPIIKKWELRILFSDYVKRVDPDLYNDIFSE